ncbi:DUF4293 domain-containing protein [Flectobacillus roseus]
MGFRKTRFSYNKMIQRTQSLLLALVVIAMGVVISSPIWEKSSAALNQKVVLTAKALEHAQGTTTVSSSTIYIAILAGLAALIAAFSISQYKKRVLQMSLGALNSAVLAGVLGASFFNVFKEGIPLFEPENQGNYALGFYAGVFALLANMIANRLIRRDEMLVRSADRMR